MSLLNWSDRRWLGNAVSASLLAAASLVVIPAQAEDGGSLRLSRNDAGTIVQAIALKSWRFDAATGELRASSTTGSRRCGITSGLKTGQTLILDGVRYPIEGFSVSGKQEKQLAVMPVIAGNLFPLCAVPSDNNLVSTGMAKGLTSGLNVEIDVLGQSAITLGVSDAIQYDISVPRTISFGLDDDVLCLQGAGESGLRVNIADSNGVITSYQGFGSIDYQPFGGTGSSQPTLRATTDTNPVCLALPATAEQVTTATAPATCSPSDMFFGDGFEAEGTSIGGAAATDLEVAFRLLSNPNVSTGANARYELIVTNCGSNAATNVQVKDFYPTGIASQKPTRLAAGTWDCTSGATCSGAEYVDVNLGEIAAGASAVITVNRPLQAGSPGEILQVSASVAELDGNGETDPIDNVASWQFDVRDNDVPVATVDGSCTIDEDAGTVDIAAAGCNGGDGFVISATDTDGTIASVSAASLNSGLVTVSGQPTFTGGGSDTVSVTGLNIDTVADANGTGTVRLTFTDNQGGEGTVDLSVSVTAVNDPPRITVLGGFDYNGGSPQFNGPNCTQNSGPACSLQSYPSGVPAEFIANFNDWVISVTPGPADESAQATAVTLSSIAGDDLFFGTTSGLPMIEDEGGTWDLSYVLSGDSGTATVTITIDDGEAENNITDFSFDITVDNSPPVVSVVGAPANIDEESVAVTLGGSGFTVAATDPEGDAVTVSVTSSDQSIIADGDIDVDASDLNDIAVTVTTQPNAFGMVDLSVVADDGTPSAAGVISLTVDNVNDVPTVVFSDAATIEADANVISFSPGDPPELTINSSLGFQFVPSLFLVSGDAVMGPGEGSVDGLIQEAFDVTIISDPSNVLDGTPGVDDAGQLIYQLSDPAVAGSAVIEVTVTDDGSPNETSAPQQLTITVDTP